ncbi:KAT regulatory NSL complex subunit 3-like protein [Trifolium pratense]|uniref:KAT regulatory NSL complex subunit 3-like protein n=1 Tax=Trifolium pratense TaxID=57577 RepID=A0A2K3LY47_TRIPR|nr:KAT regulatory NSL complex subunit 3-like protein [Trifolium pratense]
MDSTPASKRRRHSKDNETEASAPLPKQMSPVVIFAHGAGAPSSSDWMLRWKSMLKETLNAADVVTFDYPYMSGGKKRAPPKAEKLVEFHSNIVKETATKYPGHPLILAGKSMGSRVGCMVANMEDINVSAVLCLGYPLKGLWFSLFSSTLGTSLLRPFGSAIKQSWVWNLVTHEACCPFSRVFYVKIEP